MSAVTAQMVKELREKTGAGMGDCKKALEECNAVMQDAIDYLRKKGAAQVAKRADRQSKEGLAIARTTADGKTAVIVEVTSETDFVAKNADFVSFANGVADTLLASAPVASLEALLALPCNGVTLGDMYNETLGKFSEKIEVRRFEKIENEGFIAAYNHSNNKLAVVLIADTDLSDASKLLVKDFAMQIAALNPRFTNRSEVKQDDLDKEKAIAIETAIAEGKKPELAERIANGKMEKFYEENCLVEQAFVKDGSKAVKDVLAEIAKAEGKEVALKGFRRFFCGEELA